MSLGKCLWSIYRKVFPTYFSELEKCLDGCKTILDLGCGEDSPIKYLSRKKYTVGVEVDGPSIEESKKRGIHDKYIKSDVLKIGKIFKKNSFDCVLALDLIEHLKKEDGYKLLNMMEIIAKKKVIVFTPNGFTQVDLSHVDLNNKHIMHISGWSVNDFKSVGYEAIGIHGWKPVRMGKVFIKLNSMWFWMAILSALTQPLVRNSPEHAFALLCIKKV